MDDDLQSPRTLERIALVFRALGDPGRLKVLCALGPGEMSVGAVTALALLPQASVSRHLRALREAGIVGRRRAGAQVFYRLADARLTSLCQQVAKTLAAAQSMNISPRQAAELFPHEGTAARPSKRSAAATRAGGPRRSR